MALEPRPDLQIVRLIEGQLEEFTTPEFQQDLEECRVIAKKQKDYRKKVAQFRAAKQHRKRGDRLVPMARILRGFSGLNLSKPFVKPVRENRPSEASNTDEAKVDNKKRKDTFKSLRRAGGSKPQSSGDQRQPKAARSTSHN